MKRVAPLLALLLVAGCGGTAKRAAGHGPKLPRALASAWQAQANGVRSALAARDTCRAQQQALALQRSVIRAINARRVAPALQETLQSSVNDLVGRIHCVVPAPPPVQAPPEPHGDGHGHGHGHGHEKHHGHGKHGDH